MDPANRGALVLIADDNPLDLSMLFSMLSREKFDLALANDGKMVLELTCCEEPDLILLDIMMPPGMDGFEICHRLKADPATRDIPVIFMTSLNDVSSRLRGFELGAVDFVTKPFDEAELLARVRAHVALRVMTRTLTERNSRLEEQMHRREAAESALEERSRQLALRTEELARVNEQLARELAQREQMELSRAALQEEIIAVQRQRLLELSTPLSRITDQILVMPLIGVMDAERAQQVLETALRGAAELRAEFVIIDITGINGITVHVPEMLVRVSNGLRLVGASAILTGLSPEAARLFTDLNVSLGTIVTKASLQDGIAYAMRAQPGGGGDPRVGHPHRRTAQGRF
jgi:DNA-binding response OmpR family regulator/anti-anti-sigma regulatory factor